MSYLIPEDDILFVSIPGHIFSGIKEYDCDMNFLASEEYIPYTQRTIDNPRDGQYVEYNGCKYFLCETAGPGRPNYGEAYKYYPMNKEKGGESLWTDLTNMLEYVPATSMDRPISTIKHCKIETFDLSEVLVFPGNCYHSHKMEYAKDRKKLTFKYHSCYMFNPPSTHEMTKPQE